MMALHDRARLTKAALYVAVLVSFAPCPAEARLARNAQEREIARLAQAHSEQGRPRMQHDAHLHLVARAKALDMARRDYFGHADPNGIGPNHVIRMTGYRLPSHYARGRRANNVESIAAGTNYNARRAFDAWLRSAGHRRHLLASDDFGRQQTRFGVGYAKSPNSKYQNYYVFISAPPSSKRPAALTKSTRNLFLNKTPWQIKRLRHHKR
jgi:uncharacterized protein YkwD